MSTFLAIHINISSLCLTLLTLICSWSETDKIIPPFRLSLQAVTCLTVISFLLFMIIDFHICQGFHRIEVRGDLSKSAADCIFCLLWTNSEIMRLTSNGWSIIWIILFIVFFHCESNYIKHLLGLELSNALKVASHPIIRLYNGLSWNSIMITQLASQQLIYHPILLLGG